jgi:hypothetical protein
MVEHMRTEDVPEFLKSDTARAIPKKTASKGGGSR